MPWVLALSVQAQAAPVAAPWAGLPEDGAAARAQTSQEVLPALEARARRAEARARDLEATLAGEADWAASAAWLGTWDLLDPRALAGLRAEEAREARRRLAWSRTDVPSLGRRTDDRRLRDAVARTAAAEAALADATARAVAALELFLEAAPAWRRDALDAAQAPLAAVAVDDTEEGAARAAAVAAARQRWVVLERWAIGEALHGGTPPPEAAAERAVVEAWGAEPEASPAVLVLVDDALARWDRLAAADPDAVDVDAVAALLEPGRPVVRAAVGAQTDEGALHARVDALRAALARLDVGEGPLHPVRRDWLSERLRTALGTLEGLEEARQVAEAEQVAEREAAAAAAAENARREAERAQEAADAGEEHPAVAMRAWSTAWTADAWEAVEGYGATLDERTTTRRERLRALEQEAREALDAPRGLMASSAAVDAVYAKLRGFVGTLREAVSDGGPTIDEALAALPERAEDREAQLEAWTAETMSLAGEARDARLALLADTRDALAAEEQPAQEARGILEAFTADLLLDLRSAKALRHTLRDDVSRQERRIDRGAFVHDVRAELSLLGTQARALLRERLGWIAQAPVILLDFNALSAALGRMVWAAFGVLAWWGVRRRAGDLAAWVLGLLQGWLYDLPRRRRAQLVAPTTGVLRPASTVVLARYLAPMAEAVAPELGIAVQAVGIAGMLWAAEAAVELLLARVDEDRPALVTVGEGTRTLLHRSFYLLSAWYVTGWVLDRLLSDLVFADALADAVGSLVTLFGVALLVWLLDRWEPRLHTRVRRMGRTPTWMRPWVDRVGGRPASPLRAVVLGAYLLAAAVWDLAQGRAAQRDGYSALASIMDRVRFASEPEDDGRAARTLDEDTRVRLTQAEVPEGAYVERPAIEDAVLGQVRAWREDRRQGTLVVTGDRGDGKSLLLERLRPHLAVDEVACKFGRLERRLTSQDDAVRWFEDWFGLEAGAVGSPDALVGRILQQTAQIHVVRQVQHAFLRKVHGFDALRTFLYVCNATSAKHLWILGVHRPSWAFLSRLGPLVSLGSVRAVVDVAPMAGPELREVVMRRAGAVGLAVDFRRLENTGPFGAPADVERERAIQSYFRLLADASGGCPQIALHLFAKSLRPRHDGTCDVVVVPELAGRTLDGLSPDALFLLAALRMQDRLSLDEACAVLPAAPDDIRATARELEHRGILHVGSTGARIDTFHVKAVTRTLRRRHFLQWAV